MKRKNKIEIIKALENAYNVLTFSIADLNENKLPLSKLPHVENLLKLSLSELKEKFFNKEKKV